LIVQAVEFAVDEVDENVPPRRVTATGVLSSTSLASSAGYRRLRKPYLIATYSRHAHAGEGL